MCNSQWRVVTQYCSSVSTSCVNQQWDQCKQGKILYSSAWKLHRPGHVDTESAARIPFTGTLQLNGSYMMTDIWILHKIIIKLWIHSTGTLSKSILIEVCIHVSVYHFCKHSDKQTNRWRYRWTDGRTDRQTERQADRQTDRQTDRTHTHIYFAS